MTVALTPNSQLTRTHVGFRREPQSENHRFELGGDCWRNCLRLSPIRISSSFMNHAWPYNIIIRCSLSIMSGVENRRRSGSLPVAFVSAAFAERASIRFGLALFPVLAHRTGQAHLAHPALGESFTISPTEGCLSE